MNLRIQKKEEKLRRIEAAGRALFAENGFEGTTTRDLAKHAGIGVGTLFVYFPQKRALLAHLFVTDVTTVYRDALSSVDPEAPLIDGLMHVFEALYAHYAIDRRLTRVFIQELLFIDPADPDTAHAKMTFDFVAELGRLVSHAKSRGEIGADVVEADAAYHIFGAYCFNLIGWLGGMMPAPHHTWMLRRALTLLIAGMQRTTTSEETS